MEHITIAKEFDGSVSLGLLAMDNLHVAESPPELKSMLTDLAAARAAEFKDRLLGDIPAVRQVRAILHRAGLDPTRYRPSSESLLRRAVKGKGLYFINSVVDLVNYFSLKTLWPMGLYDRSRLKPPIAFRVGRAGESYEGIGRDRLNLEHFPVLADQEGPFGSPISDSMRTRVSEASTNILWITYAPAGAVAPNEDFAAAVMRFCGGAVQVSKQL